jgi:hypothetical protein
MLEDLGFQQWHVLAKDFGDIPERNPHYWVLGRKPHMSERPAEPDAQGNG